MSEEPLVPIEAVGHWIEELACPVALTGATGFVGSHLVDTLCAAGVRPRVLLRDPDRAAWIGEQPVESVEGDLRDDSALERLVDGAGTLIHLAGVVRAGDVQEFDRVNRGGTRNLVEVLRTVSPECRLVHVSSLAAAGPSEDPAGHLPEDEARPVSHYGRSKLGSEQEVRALGEGSWWTILRPPAIYGPRDTDVFQFFKMAASGWMAAPGGERLISVAFVADVVRAILAAAVVGDHGRIYHLGEQRRYELEKLLRIVARSGDVRARFIPVPATVMRLAGLAGSGLHLLGFERVPITRDKMSELLARHWTSDSSGSLVALGCEEVTPFEKGARVTWDWYRARGWVS